MDKARLEEYFDTINKRIGDYWRLCQKYAEENADLNPVCSFSSKEQRRVEFWKTNPRPYTDDEDRATGDWDRTVKENREEFFAYSIYEGTCVEYAKVLEKAGLDSFVIPNNDYFDGFEILSKLDLAGWKILGFYRDEKTVGIRVKKEN